jgi:hypothetical protein
VISSDYQYYLLAATGVSFFVFVIFALALRKDISFAAWRVLPYNKYRTKRSPGQKPLAIWIMFFGVGFASISGLLLLGATYQRASGTEPAFIPPPTQTPTPVPETLPAPEEPVQVSIRFPSSLNPCNVGALTLIPEEVDPYELPLVQPIDPWFEKQRFVQTAFANIKVANVSPDKDIKLPNLILVKVNERQPLPGPLNAAFINCESTPSARFPVVELDSSTTDTSIWINEDRFNDLASGDNHVMELKLVGVEPGLYYVNIGVQYVDEGEVIQAWSDQTIVVAVPEQIERWSAGIITYWGSCYFLGGSYECEEVVLEEPILEPEPVAEEGTHDPTAPVCTLAPPKRLEPGQEAIVSYRLGLRLRLREEPGLSGEVITSLPRGTQLAIQNEPVCKDGYWWWNVEIGPERLTGWMAEGEPRLYYLDPR